MPKKPERLFGLGTATLRGIKKCPKCGTSNGTRGLSCKNRSCSVVFKEAGERRKYSTEACQLVTGTSTRVFSVRVRDKGPDYRGFVQLPVQQSGVANDIPDSSALCFVEPCQRNFNASILQCHERNIEEMDPVVCNHIKAAMKCHHNKATTIELNTVALDRLSISAEMKEEVWSLLTDNVGPVVQRVSKYTMAVKCRVSSKHPLGYLHFSFSSSGRSDTENSFSCPCSTFKENLKHRNREEHPRCPHFYACLCALMSKESLCSEFAPYIRLEVPQSSHEMFDIASTEQDVSELSNIVFREDVSTMLGENIAEGPIIFPTVNDIENQSMGSMEVSMESDDALSFPLDQSPLLEDLDGSKVLQMEPDTLLPVQLDLPTSFVSVVDLPSLTVPFDPSCLSPQFTYTDTTIPMLLETVTKPKVPRQPPRKKLALKQSKVTNVLMTYMEWLATVTEAVNQHMHYQFDGHPSPLVFHVPQKFFLKLRERITQVTKKKSPTNTTTFTKKDSIPLGTFTKYTWALTSVAQVKHVFDNPFMPLEVEKAFVRNKDGSFVSSETCIEEIKSSQPLIKPAHFKTFIRVGCISPSEIEPTPFKIEWIPDVLPLSHIGELRIQFKFGHKPHKALS